jgi:hypothetical protein
MRSSPSGSRRGRCDRLPRRTCAQQAAVEYLVRTVRRRLTHGQRQRPALACAGCALHVLTRLMSESSLLALTADIANAIVLRSGSYDGITDLVAEGDPTALTAVACLGALHGAISRLCGGGMNALPLEGCVSKWSCFLASIAQPLRWVELLRTECGNDHHQPHAYSACDGDDDTVAGGRQRGRLPPQRIDPSPRCSYSPQRASVKPFSSAPRRRWFRRPACRCSNCDLPSRFSCVMPAQVSTRLCTRW